MADERSCAVRKKPIVGLNLAVAWNAYGVFLGGGNPPGSNPAIDAWTKNLEANLIIMRDELNIRVVRIFLLGNAANYGTTTGNVFTPPATLHPKFLEHLKAMFEAFQRTEMMVIPSLIDFKAFGKFVILQPGQPKVVQEGSVINPGQRQVDNGCMEKEELITDEKTRNTFFKQVFEPFLVASKPFKPVIYAWEVQNEPTWNTRVFFNPDRIAGGRTVSDGEMNVFLKRGLELIKTHGFESTVGHRFLDDFDDFPTGTKPQFHFYPLEQSLGVGSIVVADRSLPRFSDSQAFLGEIGCTAPADGHGALWLDLNGADAGDTRTRVRERLKFVQDRGYPMVLLWPDVDGPGVPRPDPIHLSAGAQEGVKDFMKLP